MAGTLPGRRATAASASLRRALLRQSGGGFELNEQLSADRFDRDFLVDVLFDIRQRINVFLTREADGVPAGPGTCRTADAVHVIFRILGQVEIDDVADLGDMQSASRDIGRDENRQFTALELAEQLLALVLRDIA